jgi:hypothetical protein
LVLRRLFTWLADRRKLIYVGMLLFASLIAFVVWWALQSGVVLQPTATEEPTSAPTLAEVLRFELEFERGEGKDGFRLHFTPREDGYLYIVAPDKLRRKITLLTDRPPVEMGLKSNRLQAGKDFSFPAGDWLRLSEPTADFELIFSPTPLKGSGFLSANAVRVLTRDELNFLDQLRRQSSTWSPKVEVLPNGGVITASETANTPIVVSMTVQRKERSK